MEVTTNLDNASCVSDVEIVRVQVPADEMSRHSTSGNTRGTATYAIAAGVGVAGGSKNARGREEGIATAAAAAVPRGPLTGYLRAVYICLIKGRWGSELKEDVKTHSSSPPTRSTLFFSMGR